MLHTVRQTLRLWWNYTFGDPSSNIFFIQYVDLNFHNKMSNLRYVEWKKKDWIQWKKKHFAFRGGASAFRSNFHKISITITYAFCKTTLSQSKALLRYFYIRCILSLKHNLMFAKKKSKAFFLRRIFVNAFMRLSFFLLSQTHSVNIPLLLYHRHDHFLHHRITKK